MRFLLFILPLLFSLAARAEISWQYEIEATARTPSTFEASQVEQTFREQKFLPLDGRNTGMIPWLHVDQIYSGPHDHVVFYKEGFRPNDAQVFDKVIAIKNGFLFHRLSATGRSQAFFFYQWTQNDVIQFLQKANWSQPSTAKAQLLWQMLLPKAHAESAAICLAATKSMREKLWPAKQVIDTSGVGHILKTCAVSALKGLKDGVVDLVEGTWSAVKKLVTDPEGLWNDTAEKFSQIKDLVTNLQPRLTEFFTTISQMDSDTKAEIACSTVASLVVQALIPGAIAKGAVAITEKMVMLTRLTKTLELFSRLKSLHPGIGKVTHEVLACAK